MKVHVLQHVPFEDIGAMREWLDERRAEVGYTRFFNGDALPPVDDIDLVIVMGGPMSVHDEGRFPWLADEKQFVREVIARGRPILGVCLGAQLLATVLGSRVYPAVFKEIGWLPVEASSGARRPLPLPGQCLVFHWHGETFDLPDNAELLARSAACDVQAFAYEDHVIGLQFHLEMTPAGAATLVEHCGNELVLGAYIQSRQEILETPAASYEASHRLMRDVLSHLTAPRLAVR